MADKPVMKDWRVGDSGAKPEMREVNFDGKNFIPCAIWQRDKLIVGQRIEGSPAATATFCEPPAL